MVLKQKRHLWHLNHGIAWIEDYYPKNYTTMFLGMAHVRYKGRYFLHH